MGRLPTNSRGTHQADEVDDDRGQNEASIRGHVHQPKQEHLERGQSQLVAVVQYLVKRVPII